MVGESKDGIKSAAGVGGGGQGVCHFRARNWQQKIGGGGGGGGTTIKGAGVGSCNCAAGYRVQGAPQEIGGQQQTGRRTSAAGIWGGLCLVTEIFRGRALVAATVLEGAGYTTGNWSLQSPSTMPLMMVYSLNGYCPFLRNILQLKQHSPPQPDHNMLEPSLHLHKLCRRHLKMLQLPFHQSCQQHLNVLQLHLHTSLKRHSGPMAGYLSGALIHHHNSFFVNYVSSCLRATIVP